MASWGLRLGSRPPRAAAHGPVFASLRPGALGPSLSATVTLERQQNHWLCVYVRGGSTQVPARVREGGGVGRAVWCSLAPSRGGVLQLRGNPVRGANPRRPVFTFTALALRTRTPGARALLPATRSRSPGVCDFLPRRSPNTVKCHFQITQHGEMSFPGYPAPEISFSRSPGNGMRRVI